MIKNLTCQDIKLTIEDYDCNAKDNYKVEVKFKSNFIRELIIKLIMIKELNEKFNNIILNEREQEMLLCLSKRKCNNEIAKQMNISVNTVKVHLHKLFCKLCVKDRNQAVIKALKYGLVNIDDIDNIGKE